MFQTQYQLKITICDSTVILSQKFLLTNMYQKSQQLSVRWHLWTLTIKHQQLQKSPYTIKYVIMLLNLPQYALITPFRTYFSIPKTTGASLSKSSKKKKKAQHIWVARTELWETHNRIAMNYFAGKCTPALAQDHGGLELTWGLGAAGSLLPSSSHCVKPGLCEQFFHLF